MAIPKLVDERQDIFALSMNGELEAKKTGRNNEPTGDHLAPIVYPVVMKDTVIRIIKVVREL